ncbi:MAG: RsmB/NOP family class I SAM-dependent RNA methyltransferase [Alphaproteobacteria bacterium]|nr:RsmB/NOP family class I SAM-dependent RNA methyltransferase [Alphaproteobacteria bacterium]MBV9372456.1 RsmB/NOP family class I SAM-dependent RNA methyltransferase [Alphaproteobacteria bacterium]MBV9902131.1 RsmB/NOP family class I SAM-dependent RNA methyltransferase [Alphaproteobacteria bacterium]
MTPAARVQAAIEILDEVIAAAGRGGAAADTVVSRYFSTRRYAGSKDRRAVRDHVYRAIRAWPEPPASGREALLGVAAGDPALLALFDGSPHGPAPAPEAGAAPAAGEVPAWLIPRLDPVVGPDEWPSLLGRAPLDLRVNRLRGTRDEALAGLPEAAPTPLSPLGLRLSDRIRVEEEPVWNSGLVEIQDEGSQLLSLACTAAPGLTVVDLCAGAGGKTLALAAEMANEGRLLASDTDRARLSRMPPRLARAGVDIVETRLLDPGREREALADLAGGADIVLVDAPCSGTGTWRRNPELRWRLTARRLEQLVKTQAYLIDLGAELVRPGGILIYAVCSLLAEEGRAQADAFSDRSALVPESAPITGGRVAGPGLLLTPGHDGTDGFFVARWRAPC